MPDPLEPAEAPSRPGRPARLVGWNVGRRRARPVHRQVLGALRPDVLALVDTGRRLDLVPPALARHVVWAPPADGAGGACLASRWPLIDPDVRPLGRGPHLAGRLAAARVRVPGLGRFRVAAVYVPTRARGREVKEAFLRALWRRLGEWAGQPLVLLGDLNIAEAALDETRPFLEEWEREWMRRLLGRGLIDAFRALHPRQARYTWWSHRGQGWRIDHALVSRTLEDRLRACRIVDQARRSGASDHAAVLLALG